MKQTTEGLVKLLMYGDYVKAKAAFQNVPHQSIVEEDLKKYQYKRKHTYKVGEYHYEEPKICIDIVLGAPFHKYGFVRKALI